MRETTDDTPGNPNGTAIDVVSDETISDPVSVLFIGGMGRSGSTLLCRTLGSIEGFVGTGELMRVLGRGVLNGDLCSCGSPVIECGLWSAVRRELDRQCSNLDFERLERTRKRVTESWEFVRYLFLSNRGSTLAAELDEYRRFLAALYRSVRAVTGARVVVDSSKNVFFARLLTETSGLRITLLHLVRDSRGVAHSWMRRQERPGTNGRREHFRVVGPVMGSILWTGANLMTEWTGRRTERRHFMRYEDFVAAPAATLRALLDTLDAPADPARLSHVNGRAVRLGVDHLIASNPNRRRRGDIELREDERWRHEMGAGRRSLVTGMTLPLLRRYGYQLRPGTPVAAPASKRTRDEIA